VPDIDRVRVDWEGMPGGPGVNTFYALDGVVLRSALGDFYNQIAPIVPANITFQIHFGGDTIDSSSGDLTGSWGVSGRGPQAAEAVGPYSAPTGAVVTWDTGVVFDGSRLRGRSFLVPLVGSAFTTEGAVAPTTLQVIQDAASALMIAGGQSMVVWHRPTPAHVGQFALATSAFPSPKAAVLRSRRD
jgi:hypothetical protein